MYEAAGRWPGWGSFLSVRATSPAGERQGVEAEMALEMCDALACDVADFHRLDGIKLVQTFEHFRDRIESGVVAPVNGDSLIPVLLVGAKKLFPVHLTLHKKKTGFWESRPDAENRLNALRLWLRPRA